MGRKSDTSVRERLLATASKLFYEEGINAVGIQRVIDEADAAKASLYAHFPSKDDLVAAYLERISEQVRKRFDTGRAAAGADPRQQVLSYFDVLSAWGRTGEFRGCPFTIAKSELGGPDHPANAVIRAHRAWIREELGRDVAATGIPRPAEITDELMVLLDGAAAATQLDDDPNAVEVARRTAARLLG